MRSLQHWCYLGLTQTKQFINYNHGGVADLFTINLDCHYLLCDLECLCQVNIYSICFPKWVDFIRKTCYGVWKCDRKGLKVARARAFIIVVVCDHLAYPVMFLIYCLWFSGIGSASTRLSAASVTAPAHERALRQISTAITTAAIAWAVVPTAIGKEFDWSCRIVLAETKSD